MENLRNEEGLTLVETIIALVLMLMLIAAFAGAMTVALQREVEVDKRLEASNLASGIVEYLGEGDNLDNLISGYNFDNGVNFGFSDLPNDVLDDDLFISYDDSYILVEEYNGINDLYKITVNIKWEDRDNDWSHELVTLLAVDKDE